ncbi:NERD domain-containing protein [Dietzia sp. B32]|uniref:NERD domain-containing protein n=1 Tax=Dietzia sp. B32 TaxID=2915130 RepID=UPI0021ADEBFD|nr:NERD domain-containing protein [Dietzia sp. B32]UVE94406.1 NERD domain-containing protein [Dietzia sp. B32]
MILVPSLADIERRAESNAERTFARLLQRTEGDTDAVAFHSVRLREHRYKQQAEADFVILWKRTVVVVEVKGGGVRKHDGTWYSVDRHNDWHKLSSSPMEQAQSAAHALREILRKDNLGWFPYQACVVTPDIDSPPDDIGWKRTHWLALPNMSGEGIAAALNAIVAEAQSCPPRQRPARVHDLRTRLFGEFTRMPVIDAQRGAVIEEQNRATSGQARVLAALSRNDRLLVAGGAGTGKSLVLIEAAKQESDRGKSVLITFKSPSLTLFFTNYLVGTRIDVIPFDALDTDHRYDVVLVDEAQDMMTANAMDKIDQVVAGGRVQGRWRMFLDQNNQAHVDGSYDPDVVELLGTEAIWVDLDLNVRNTQAIVHIVQEYLGADVGDPGIVHGEKVQWVTVPESSGVTDGETVAATLVESGVARASVWIIDVASESKPFQSPLDFKVVSPRYAKGLEAEHVIVCNLPSEFDSVGTARFYVAVTRARVSLHIVITKEDRRRLQRMVKEITVRGRTGE